MTANVTLPETGDEQTFDAQGTSSAVARGPWQLAWARLRRDRVAMISLGFIVFIALVAIFAPVLAHITHHGRDQLFNGPGVLSADDEPSGPNGHFWFGVDPIGRDVMVRTAYGARISLEVGVVATLLATALGTVLGMAAGFLGTVVDTIIARLIDVVLAVPFVLFAVALAVRFHASLGVVIIVLTFFSWASVARIVRGQVLSIREREYIEAARSLGASSRRIMFVDVLPNVLAQVIVLASLLVPAAIVAEATLSFLGVGVQPPTPSWGNLIAQNSVNQGAWWVYVFPGIFLLLTTLAFNLLGDGVRDAFDPRGDRTFGRS
ncbi:MAG TPA: ABC transporter permease [Mycobacteriales bacterium]|nr:ABC transporter permease [Mycobacteriales bacterium]